MNKIKILLRKIIQGGMGVSISAWLLARLVSLSGGLGTVSGVGAERILAYTLQKGDPGGHFRRALNALCSNYPKLTPIVKEILGKYFVEGGIKKGVPYKKVEMFSMNPSSFLIALTVCGNYSLVWLAKEGHDNPISINWLEKVQLPHIYSLVGAMLAGVDCVTVGAGFPYQFPEVMEQIIQGKNPSYKIDVKGNQSARKTLEFDLVEFFGEQLPKFERPFFLPIISTNMGAEALVRGCPEGSIDGFLVENYKAAGHNARPRVKLATENNEPIYGPKDECDFKKLKTLGIPFWIGGAMAYKGGVQDALALGAQGIQVGSISELAEESGLRPDLKNQIRKEGYNGTLVVKNYNHISPTGFPFHEVSLKNTLSEKEVYERRKRICNIGLLRTVFAGDDGTFIYLCPAENEKIYQKKGGKTEDTIGKVCLCNALFANADLNNAEEPCDVTLSKYYGFLKDLMSHEKDYYTVKDVMDYLRG